MKDVLISIQPYWVFLIIAKIMGWNIGKEKMVEVRKNHPKAENWNKVAKIYCSKDKRSFTKIPKEYQPFMEQFLGKVIGEFVCDKIEHIEIRHFTVFGHENRYAAVGDNPDHQWLTKSCLSYDEVVHYGEMAPLYGWHISDLVIYDKPKGLDEFIVKSDLGCCNEGKCRNCHFFDKGNGFNVEDDCTATFDTDEYKPLRRPPQSWCYVEG